MAMRTFKQRSTPHDPPLVSSSRGTTNLAHSSHWPLSVDELGGSSRSNSCMVDGISSIWYSRESWSSYACTRTAPLAAWQMK